MDIPELELDFAVPDDEILAFVGGKKNEVKVYQDFVMDSGVKDEPDPIPLGVYDARIFGKMKHTQPRVADTVAGKHWGYIDLGFYYCPYFMVKKMAGILKLLNISWLSDGDKSPTLESILNQANYAQFEAQGSDTILVTDDITDDAKCGWEGLIDALESLNRGREAQLVRSGLNKYLTVCPIEYRPMQKVNGEINNHEITNLYRCVLWGLDKIKTFEREHRSRTEEEAARLVAMRYLVRRIINKFNGDMKIVQGGKQNYSRAMQNNRIKSSGRAVIVPDPILKIDQVGIPIHLAYQMADEEFVEYLQNYYNGGVKEGGEVDVDKRLSVQEAWSIYKKADKHTQELFFDYIDGVIRLDDGTTIKDPLGPKLCIINRQPTLHQLSMLVCHVRLTYDKAISYPIALCSPLNADFDGDTIAVDFIPKVISELAEKVGSPRNLIYWRKNGKPLFTPSHESTQGHMLMSEPMKEGADEVGFDSLEEAIKTMMKDWKKKPSERTFFWNTPIRIDSVSTTIGRAILSAIYSDELDSIERILANGYCGYQTLSIEERETKYANARLRGVNAADIEVLLIRAANLEADEDEDPEMKARGKKLFKAVSSHYDGKEDITREMRIQAAQHWTLYASTKAGATAPRLSNLYIGVDPELDKQIKEIENSSLDDISKSIKVKEVYEKFVNEKVMASELEKIGSNAMEQVDFSARAKRSQMLEMTMPNFYYNPETHSSYVTTSTYVQGQNIDDYVVGSSTNRGVQVIKHEATPTSGYATRQVETVCNNWDLVDGKDAANEGILIPAKEGLGRTGVDGKLITQKPSSEYVRVRSVITSTQPRFRITDDMIDQMHEVYRDPVDKRFKILTQFKKPNAKMFEKGGFTEADYVSAGRAIGTGIATAMTESVTQASLGLKHGGFLLDYDKLSMLYAGCYINNMGKKVVLDGCDNLDWDLSFDGDWIILNSGSKTLRYWKPTNYSVVAIPGKRIKTGDLIGASVIQFTPALKTDGFIALIHAQGGEMPQEYLRNNIIHSECFAIADGDIHYLNKEMKGGKMKRIIKIGDVEYEYNSDSLYMLPEGMHVEKGQRFASGIQDMGMLLEHGKKGEIDDMWTWMFRIFSEQARALIAGLTSFSLEFLFTVLFTNENHELRYIPIDKIVDEDGSLFARIARRSPKETMQVKLSDLPKEERENLTDAREGNIADFTMDQLTFRLLPTLIHSIGSIKKNNQ